MDWVKLAQRYFHDPKIRGLDDAAELMFVRGQSADICVPESRDGSVHPVSCDLQALAVLEFSQPQTVPQPGRRSRGRSAWQPGWCPAFLHESPTGIGRSVRFAYPQGMPEVSV